MTVDDIAHAIGVNSDELSHKDIVVALLTLETTLDTVAESLEDDFDAAALGDASNLIQLIREGLRTNVARASGRERR